MAALSTTQQALLTQAQNLLPLVHSDGSVTDVGILVSGNKYQTALALERKGLGKVRYQGPGNRGWFTAPKHSPAPKHYPAMTEFVPTTEAVLTALGERARARREARQGTTASGVGRVR